MKTRYAFALLMGIACSLATAGDAKAQYGFNGGCGYGYGCGVYDLGRLYGVLADNVPYFAAFPPVYYSTPVPRTYGYSPFAYPPGVMTPDVVENATPVEIINPHIKPASTTDVEGTDAEEPADKLTRTEAAPTPLLVMNPYVSTRVAEASVQLGR
jgi:hypothetical protein